MSSSAGSITEGARNYLIRTAGEYTDINQIRNTVVAYKGGAAPAPGTAPSPASVVLLRDIADVYDGYKDEEQSVFINGRPAVTTAAARSRAAPPFVSISRPPESCTSGR